MIDRSLAGRFFSRPSAVLVSAHDGGVNHHVLVVVIARQQLENALENSALRPSTETLMRYFPVAETRRQITPGHARSKPIENGFDEQPIVRRRAANVALAARQKILDPFPLVIAYSKALYRSALLTPTCQESHGC